MIKPNTPAYIQLAYKAQVNRLAQNENPNGPSPKVLDAVINNIHKISHYPDVVVSELKEKLASMHQVSPKQIFVSNGSGIIIDMLVQRILPNGFNMVIPEITFVAYKICATIHKRECLMADMENYTISLENIKKLINKDTRLVFLANPNNPTGSMLTHNEIENFIQSIPGYINVVIDEAYWEYVTATDYPDSLSLFRKYPNVIILHSFSKIYGLAGLRIGYGIAPEDIVDELEVSRLPFTIGTLSNIAAMAALDDKDFVRESAAMNAEGRAFMTSELSSLGYRVIPSQGNFIYLPFSSQQQRDLMHNTLYQNNMVVRKMDNFGDPLALRISIGLPEDNKRLVECLKKG